MRRKELHSREYGWVGGNGKKMKIKKEKRQWLALFSIDKRWLEYHPQRKNVPHQSKPLNPKIQILQFVITELLHF